MQAADPGTYGSLNHCNWEASMAKPASVPWCNLQKFIRLQVGWPLNFQTTCARALLVGLPCIAGLCPHKCKMHSFRNSIIYSQYFAKSDWLKLLPCARAGMVPNNSCLRMSCCACSLSWPFHKQACHAELQCYWSNALMLAWWHCTDDHHVYKPPCLQAKQPTSITNPQGTLLWIRFCCQLRCSRLRSMFPW